MSQRSSPSARRDGAIPGVVLEVLRFCIVVFFAGLGYQIADAVEHAPPHLGPFTPSGLGIVLGAAIGYVLGGVLGRLTGRTLARAEAALVSRSPEQVLAGLVGAVVGVLLGAGLTWPMLLIGSAVITFPIFAFVCITTGVLGYRVGLDRRDVVLPLLGAGAGLHKGPPALAAVPRLVDSSVAIDGRILDVVRAGFVHGRFLVCQPVLDELQGMADAADDTRRSRGRRGLDVLEALRAERGVDVEVLRDEAPDVPDVDAKLVRIALDRQAALLTLDAPLAKVAALAGCRVMNLHALTVALRPSFAAGDTVRVSLIRPGKEAGQAVGYLDDGTMVVVERGREHIGSEVSVTVTSILLTANGRMVFAKPDAAPATPGPAHPPASPTPPARTSQAQPSTPTPSPSPGPRPRPGGVPTTGPRT